MTNSVTRPTRPPHCSSRAVWSGCGTRTTSGLRGPPCRIPRNGHEHRGTVSMDRVGCGIGGVHPWELGTTWCRRRFETGQFRPEYLLKVQPEPTLSKIRMSGVAMTANHSIGMTPRSTGLPECGAVGKGEQVIRSAVVSRPRFTTWGHVDLFAKDVSVACMPGELLDEGQQRPVPSVDNPWGEHRPPPSDR